MSTCYMEQVISKYAFCLFKPSGSTSYIHDVVYKSYVIRSNKTDNKLPVTCSKYWFHCI